MQTDDTTISITGGDGEVLLPPMSSAEFSKMADRARAADFALEPETPGEIPQRVIDELVHARTVAKDYAEAFNSAVTAQAEKYKIAPGALKRYVNAREADAMAKLNKETADLEKLIGVTE